MHVRCIAWTYHLVVRTSKTLEQKEKRKRPKRVRITLIPTHKTHLKRELQKKRIPEEFHFGQEHCRYDTT